MEEQWAKNYFFPSLDFRIFPPSTVFHMLSGVCVTIWSTVGRPAQKAQGVDADVYSMFSLEGHRGECRLLLSLSGQIRQEQWAIAPCYQSIVRSYTILWTFLSAVRWAHQYPVPQIMNQFDMTIKNEYDNRSHHSCSSIQMFDIALVTKKLATFQTHATTTIYLEKYQRNIAKVAWQGHAEHLSHQSQL